MTDDNDNGLASRLREHAKGAARDAAESLIERIIAERRAILDLCAEGHSARQINAWLAKEGLHIGDGTLRNYIARIRAAERHARDMGMTVPDDADILRICRDRERAKLNRPKAGRIEQPMPRIATHPPHTATADRPAAARPLTAFHPRSDTDL